MGGKHNIALSWAAVVAVTITVTATALACHTADSHPNTTTGHSTLLDEVLDTNGSMPTLTIRVQRSEPGVMTWADAKRYCENLTADGHKDWRLPLLDELQQIYATVSGSQSSNTSIKILGNPEGFAPREYWSATEENDKHIHAWVVDFSRGRTYGNNKTFCNHVRCVRDE